MIGPSKFLHFPNAPQLVAAGLLVAGAGRVLAVGFTVNEAIQSVSKLFPEQETRISDLSVNLFFISDGLAMMTFPVVGSALSEHLSFERAQEVFALLNMIVLLVYASATAYDWRK